MKRHMRKHMKLADVIRVVSELSRDDHETGIIVADLINRGLVRFDGQSRRQKVIVK